jgi:hypothetical protein
MTEDELRELAAASEKADWRAVNYMLGLLDRVEKAETRVKTLEAQLRVFELINVNAAAVTTNILAGAEAHNAIRELKDKP